MSKKIFLFFLFFGCLNVYAQQNNSKDWILDRFNFYFEDDVYTKTDDGYSSGERLSWLYFIPDENYDIFKLFFMDFGESHSYVTFALTNQIFTPTETEKTELIPYDRPYAGWTYFEAGMHKNSRKHLRSIVLKVGIIGPASLSEDIQNGVHSIIGSHEVKGWDNQLNNELGVNLKYTHKWLFESKKFGDFEMAGVPFLSAELGNVAINATGGVSARFGYNIPRDFGVSSIDIGADPGIPIYGEYKTMKSKKWSFSVNFLGAASAVGRDIFLDGNTFTDSHSVEKENFVYYYGFGFTLRYKNFVLDFMEINNSKKFKLEKKGHGVGTLVFSWLY